MHNIPFLLLNKYIRRTCMKKKQSPNKQIKTRTFVTVNVDLQVRVSAVCVVYYVWINEIVCNVCWLPSLDVYTSTYMYLMKCNYSHGIQVLYTLYNMKDHNETKICLCYAAEIAKRLNEYIDLKKKLIKILFLFLRSLFNSFSQ